ELDRSVACPRCVAAGIGDAAKQHFKSINRGRGAAQQDQMTGAVVAGRDASRRSRGGVPLQYIAFLVVQDVDLGFPKRGRGVAMGADQIQGRVRGVVEIRVGRAANQQVGLDGQSEAAGLVVVERPWLAVFVEV